MFEKEIKTRHYVTLFDINYSAKGLSLHKSMRKWCGEFKLWIICLDVEVFNLLTALCLESTELILLDEIENEQFLRIKNSRTLTEYYWTLTPHAIKSIFQKMVKVDEVTYVDADIYFLENPEPIYNEFEKSQASVLITEHAYSPQNDLSRTSGKYCVQFLVFKRRAQEIILETWENQCLEWCFNRFEDGKFGDQMYLDHWPQNYGSEIHVLSHKEWALGPWNASRFPFSEGIFYHFHQVKFPHKKILILGNYDIPDTLIKNVYSEYFKSLRSFVSIDPSKNRKYYIIIKMELILRNIILIIMKKPKIKYLTHRSI